MGAWQAAEEDFCVELSENSFSEGLEPEQAPLCKRHNAGATPERFRAGLQPPPPPASSGAAPPAALFAPHQQVDPPSGGPSSSGGGMPQPTRGGGLRSLFLAPPQPAAVTPAAQRQPLPGGTQGAPPRSPGLVGLCGAYACGVEDEDDVPGPLTQIAAAHAPVASAFCPHCGAFLPDLGSPGQQAAHTAGCQASEGRASGAAAAGGSRQQAGAGGGLRKEAPGPSSRDAAAVDAGDEEACQEEEEEEEEDLAGNWSEQEEATQAAPGGRAAAAGLRDGQADEGSSSPAEGEEDEGSPVWDLCSEEEEEDAEAGGNAGWDEGNDERGGSAGVPGLLAAGGSGEAAGELGSWLERHGLAKYADHFHRAGASLSLLPCLSDADLVAMGIAALGARKKLLLAAEELAVPEEAAAAAAGGGGSPAEQQQQEQEEGQLEARRGSHQQAGTGRSGVGDWRSLVGGNGPPALANCSILQYYKPQGGGKGKAAAAGPPANPGSILAYLKAPDGSSLPAPPPQQRAGGGGGRGRGAKAAGQQWAHKAVAAGGKGGGKRWGPRAAQVLPMWEWQLVPGTSFVVDRFCNLPQQSPYRHWFLTHFHADHYKGLTGKFDRGVLYCSPPTARLVVQQLRVKQGCIREVPLNSPIVVDGVRVTFLDANHCPGAVMILFEPPGRRPVLHTGDCRLVPEMQQEEALAAVKGRAELILDTTYCSPEYAFPSQQEVLRFAIDAVKAEAFNPKTLFLFGSYTIGKERLFLEAARVLQRKIYVSVAKRKILDCLDLPEEVRTLLTTDDRETNLHAVPLWMVSQQHMAKLLKHYRGRFTNAVGFQPTGWTHQRNANQTKARGRRRQKGTVITYQVPYSEHSSFSELRAFVGWFRPTSIIPSVNSDGGGPKAQALVRLLRSGGNGGPGCAPGR